MPFPGSEGVTGGNSFDVVFYSSLDPKRDWTSYDLYHGASVHSGYSHGTDSVHNRGLLVGPDWKGTSLCGFVLGMKVQVADLQTRSDWSM
jgi:hypothetical protein